jgi:hypothetical protein
MIRTSFATAAVLLLSASALLAPSAARAAIPTLNATCPGKIEVHADAGGPIYINGSEGNLKKFSDSYFEAKDSKSGVTISLTLAPDGTPRVSYTGSGGANGVCQVVTDAFAAAPKSAAAPGSSSATAVAESACIAAVATKVGVSASTLLAIEVLPSEAGVGVTVRVPGADAPWSCLSDTSGNVQGVTYTGSEGKL